MLAEGQAVLFWWGGEQLPGIVDRAWSTGLHAQIQPAAGLPQCPCVVPLVDITPTPDPQDLQRVREALKAIGERGGLTWERTCEVSAEAIGHPLLPEEMDLAQLAVAQAALRAEVKATNGLAARK